MDMDTAWTRTLSPNGEEQYTRPLGDSEYAFHAFSHTGVGDMFLHLSLLAPPELLAPQRVLLAWCSLLLRHPLLLSSVVSPSSSANAPPAGGPSEGEPVFRFTPPKNLKQLLAAGRERLGYERCTKQEWVDRYMNGPERGVNDGCIARLVIGRAAANGETVGDSASVAAAVDGHTLEKGSNGSSIINGGANGVPASSCTPTDPVPADPPAQQGAQRRESYDVYLCAPHFSGDALPLHQSANDLLALLASEKTDEELTASLERKLKALAGKWTERLPLPVEALLPLPPSSRLARAAAQVNYLQSQSLEVGGHVLPRAQRGAMKTVLLERGFSKEQTGRILKRCKQHRVSANHAVFALVAMAWSRVNKQGWELPIMNYTALSLRPYLTYPTRELERSMSYWFVALTYFNIVLPSFLPISGSSPNSDKDSDRQAEMESVFWHRTVSARDQIGRIAKSHFLVQRARIMSSQRAEKAGRKLPPADPVCPVPRAGGPVNSEKHDISFTSSTVHIRTKEPTPIPPPPSDALLRLTPYPSPAAPSKALMGISLMGNLDKIYLSPSYPQLTLLDVATASRQKAGGVLLLAHTFAGRMWFHLAYDAQGFEEGRMERFWGELGGLAERLLVG